MRGHGMKLRGWANCDSSSLLFGGGGLLIWRCHARSTASLLGLHGCCWTMAWSC